MQVCGYAGLRYAVRIWKGIEHMALWFHGYAPSRGFFVFTPYYAGWQGIGSMVSFTPYASTHMGSLRIVEFQVP